MQKAVINLSRTVISGRGDNNPERNGRLIAGGAKSCIDRSSIITRKVLRSPHKRRPALPGFYTGLFSPVTSLSSEIREFLLKHKTSPKKRDSSHQEAAPRDLFMPQSPPLYDYVRAFTIRIIATSGGQLSRTGANKWPIPRLT